LLTVSNLVTEFPSRNGRVKAVDGVSFTLGEGEIIALVGESGCGKSVTSLSIMRLVDSNNGEISPQSSIIYKGQNLLSLSSSAMRKIRGNKISMIFQEPMTSLNPVYTIGNQVAEVFHTHQALSSKAAWEEAQRMLDLVRIPSARRIMNSYPHELSGGMLQRVMIAIALSCRPELLIADEPTTALDVTIQAQILHLMQELQRELGMAILLVTHDLGIVAETCSRVLVMYAGRIIEEAPTYQLFTKPQHPYTQGLLNSIPSLGQRKERLACIEGRVPSMQELPPGCRFYERCNQRLERCRIHYPPQTKISHEQSVACWLYEKE
jgi:peptide/nickel transport system ATP-binding protein/oligopeptide transport system ATP-binding protein